MRTATIFKALLSALLLIVIVGFIPIDKNSIGKINFILGGKHDVSIIRAGKSEWQDAKIYASIFKGDQIKTNRESRCETKLLDQSVVRIGENTTFIFKEDQLNKNFDTEIQKGRLWANIRKISRRTIFQVRTPTAVCSIRGTIYRIDADSSTKLVVYQGSVDVGPLWAVKNDTIKTGQQKKLQTPHEIPGPTQVPGPFEVTLDQWVRIVAGQQIEIRADGKYHRSNINDQIDSVDDWVVWNKMRDQSQ